MDTRIQVVTKALEKLKQSEGFSDKPYWDFTQLSIGYGSSVSAEEAAYITGAAGMSLTQLLALGQRKCNQILAQMSAPRLTVQQALDRLQTRVERDLDRLESLTPATVKLSVTQKVALVDYLYNKGNLGPKATAALKAGKILELAYELDVVTAGGKFHRVVYGRTIESVVELLLYTPHIVELPNVLKSLQDKASKRPGYTA
jgi:GH24 family phage-related lysozyme (muramidase)